MLHLLLPEAARISSLLSEASWLKTQFGLYILLCRVEVGGHLPSWGGGDQHVRCIKEWQPRRPCLALLPFFFLLCFQCGLNNPVYLRERNTKGNDWKSAKWRHNYGYFQHCLAQWLSKGRLETLGNPKTLSEGLWAESHFHNNRKMLLAFLCCWHFHMDAKLRVKLPYISAQIEARHQSSWCCRSFAKENRLFYWQNGDVNNLKKYSTEVVGSLNGQGLADWAPEGWRPAPA